MASQRSSAPRVLFEHNLPAGHEQKLGSRIWITLGATSGMVFGATLGGPAGALVGGVIGSIGGVVRASTGKSIVQHWVELDEESRQHILGQATDVVGSSSRGSPGPAVFAADSNQAMRHNEGLSLAEVEALRDTPAEPEEPTCKVCLVNKVVVALQPCGHACLCAACCSSVLRGDGTVSSSLCPVCRSPVSQVLRLFF